MRHNWKTSLGAILGGLFLGLSEAPGITPFWAHICKLLSGAAMTTGLLFARDYDKSSEDSGIK